MDSGGRMIRSGFLGTTARQELLALMRDGKAENRMTRRANAIILLDDGWSCEEVAEALYFNDDTIRDWYRAWETNGVQGLREFGYKGSACELSVEQQSKLKRWVTETLPRSAAPIGAWIEKEFDVSYTRSAIIKLMHRIGMEFKKPHMVSQKMKVEQQRTFIKLYNKILNALESPPR
jgi:transposase